MLSNQGVVKHFHESDQSSPGTMTDVGRECRAKSPGALVGESLIESLI